jgi:PKHD-type hydroxylase
MLNSPISYVTSENIFTREECQEIIEKGKSKGYGTGAKIGDINLNSGLPYNQLLNVDEKIRKTDLFFFSDSTVYERLMPHISRINSEVGWNFSMSRFEPLQLSVYNEGGHYDWHVDEHPTPYTEREGPFHNLVRKLSFSLILTDKDYEGGEFEVEDQLPGYNPRSTMVDGLDKAGSIVVFPSFTPHKVHPVTSGTRYSLVGWICGEPWR